MCEANSSVMESSLSSLSALARRLEHLAALDRAGQLFTLDALPALSRLQARNDQLSAEADRLRRVSTFLRDRLLHHAARRLAAKGHTRIALLGAGYHTQPITEQPWAFHGLRVTLILDDNPPAPALRGVPVRRPDQLSAEELASFDTVVISSDSAEPMLAARAAALFAGTKPIERIYGDLDDLLDPDAAHARVARHLGNDAETAAWLLANRMERQDSTLPLVDPRIAEIHVRRYEFAAAFAAGRRVLDIASGLGYGSALLHERGRAAAVLGVEPDATAVSYASRRFGSPNVTFRTGIAEKIPLPDRSVDLVVSFETLEHVNDPDAMLTEIVRTLSPGGTAIISVPNEDSPQPHHKRHYDYAAFRKFLMGYFLEPEDWAQVEQDEPRTFGRPPGFYRIDAHSPRPDHLLMVCKGIKDRPRA